MLRAPELTKASLDLVRDVRGLTLELPALDVGDPHLVAVDGSGSGAGPAGAFAIIDGAGNGRCYTFLIGPDGEPASGRSYLLEAIAADAALAPSTSGTAVTLISDSKDVAALIRTARSTQGRRLRTMVDRRAPEIAWGVRRHCVRLDVTMRLDTSRPPLVAETPHMVAAHRLALGALRLRTAGHDPAEDGEARDWLIRFSQYPGRNITQIKTGGTFGQERARAERAAAAVEGALRPLPEVLAELGVTLSSVPAPTNRAVRAFRRKRGFAHGPERGLRGLLVRMAGDPDSRAAVLPGGELLITLDGPTVVLDARAERVERYANRPESIILAGWSATP